MQAIFSNNEEAVKAFRSTMSEARFARYLATSNGDAVKAIQLYYWNARLGQSLYTTLQMWEIALRNKLNRFLCWKFNPSWPHERDRAVRQLTQIQQRKLRETIDRQQNHRKIIPVPTDAIVADLSAGFWVGLLAKSYDVPFAWRYNLARIFPHEQKMGRDEAASNCESLLDLRNRVAHHEPIFQLPLDERRAQLDRILAAICPASRTYAQQACTFDAVWNDRPNLN